MARSKLRRCVRRRGAPPLRPRSPRRRDVSPLGATSTDQGAAEGTLSSANIASVTGSLPRAGGRRAGLRATGAAFRSRAARRRAARRAAPVAAASQRTPRNRELTPIPSVPPPRSPRRLVRTPRRTPARARRAWPLRADPARGEPAATRDPRRRHPRPRRRRRTAPSRRSRRRGKSGRRRRTS